MTRSSQVRVESQNLSSHFESLVCKLESMSSRVTWNFTFFLLHFLCYKMAPNTL